MAEQLNTGAAEGAQSTAPEGHDEQMLQTFEESQKQPQPEAPATGGGEDELILGKFQSQEELAEAYRNLEAKLSAGGDTEQPQEELEQAAEDAVEKAQGVDMESLSQEFAENGELSDSSYEALDAAGIPREMVDQYISGQEARAEAVRSEILDEVGGEDSFGKMAEWAGSNMSPEQLDRYNAAVDSNDPTRMREAVQSLAYQYTKANGSEPNLMGGSAGSAGSAYESVAQLTKAMEDPRYATDPAYRAEVADKLSRSNVL